MGLVFHIDRQSMTHGVQVTHFFVEGDDLGVKVDFESKSCRVAYSKAFYGEDSSLIGNQFLTRLKRQYTENFNRIFIVTPT